MDGFVLIVFLLPDPLDDGHPLEDDGDHCEDGEEHRGEVEIVAVRY